MKKKFNVMAVAIFLSGTVLFSSCIGSFGLFNKLLAWNKTVGDKFINELVFVALCIVPVYPIAYAADILVLNSIEFWTGENPVADNTVKHVKGQDGHNYTIVTNKNGHHITKDGTNEVVDFRYDKTDKTWSVISNGKSSTMLKVVNDKQVIMYLPDGTEFPVKLDESGVVAFKQAAVDQNTYFYAAK